MNHTDYRGSCPHTGLIGSKVSQTAEKSRYRRIFSKALSLFLLLTAALLSASLEMLQWTTGLGVADVDDVLCNTLGAFLGWLLRQEKNRT